jgi:hypothetical protein
VVFRFALLSQIHFQGLYCYKSCHKFKCRRLFSESLNHKDLMIDPATNTHTYQSFILLKSSAKIVLTITLFLAKRALYMAFEAGQVKKLKKI